MKYHEILLFVPFKCTLYFCTNILTLYFLADAPIFIATSIEYGTVQISTTKTVMDHKGTDAIT